MANLFEKKQGNSAVSLKTLEAYLNFLTEHFPVYVSSNFCESEVIRCVEKYEELYSYSGSGESLLIYPGNLSPNLKYFNSKYNGVVADYIERTTISFLCCEE